jgi:hypothetical protein
VSLFVLSPEIEDRNAVEVDNWARHKKSFSTLNDIYYFIFKGITKTTKIEHELTYLFSIPAVTIFKF